MTGAPRRPRGVVPALLPARDEMDAPARYHTLMQPETIRYAGRYRFDGREALDRALAVARDQLDLDDDLATIGSGWMGGFVREGTTVTITLAIPAIAELRLAAAELFENMSQAAVDGLVEGTIGGRYVDYYPSGGED